MRNPGLVVSAFGSLLSKPGDRFRFCIKICDNNPLSGGCLREEKTAAKASEQRITQLYTATSVFMGKTHSL